MDQFSSSLAAASLVDGQHFTLPGYGTLEGTYVSARINHVEREVSPPRLEVTWTSPPVPGAQSFAELLINTGATTAEAIDAQDAWLDALERGDRVVVGDLGHLVLDGNNNLVQWCSNEEALANAYWTGGAVAVSPLRDATPAAGVESDGGGGGASAKTATAAAAPPTVVHARKPAGGHRKLLRYAALFAGVLIGLILLRNVTSGGAADEGDAVAVTISNDRLNRSPLDGAAATDGVLDDVYEEPDYNPDLGPGGSGEGFDPANLAGERPSRSADARIHPREDHGADSYDTGGGEHVVILGSFGRAKNAERFKERLLQGGHLPYVDQYNGLTRVGVTVATERRGELTEALARLRSEYNENAWVLE